MLKRTLISFVLAASFGAAGCGDIGSKPSSNSSTGGGVSLTNNGVKPGPGTGDFSFGVDSSRTVNDLSDAEYQTACDNFESFLRSEFSEDEVNNFTCTVFGYFAASETEDAQSAQQACVATRDQCLQDPEPLEFNCPLDDAAGCDVTVAQVETCTNAQFETIGAAVRELTCSEATPDSTALEAFEQDIPECEPIDSCQEPNPTEPVDPPPGG